MSTRFWIGALLVLPQGVGETTVGALGDPARWELAGARSFEARSVLGAVLGVGELRAAGRAGSPRAKFLRLIESSIASGYQRAGFAQVKVTAAPSEDGARLLIQVEEGPQSRAGAVRVEGNQQVDDATIAGALAAVWKAGEPAQSDPAVLTEAWRLVATCYAEHGYFAARGSVVTVAEAGAASLALEVRVAEEGRSSTVTRLEIAGDGDDPAAIAARVGFVPGAVWTTRAREDLIARFRALGRYLDIELDDQRRDAEGRIDPLRVTLTSAPNLPDWDRMPWDELALLTRGVAWLRERFQSGAPIRVRLVSRVEAAPVWLSIGPGTAELVASTREISFSGDLWHWWGSPLGPCTLVASPGSLQVAGTAGAMTVPFRAAATLIGRLAARPLPRGQRGSESFWFEYWFGFSTNPEKNRSVKFELDLHEAALLSQLRLASIAWTPDGRSLSLVRESAAHGVSIRAQVDRATAAMKLHLELAPRPDLTVSFDLTPDSPLTRPTETNASQPQARDLAPLLAKAIESVGSLLFGALGVEDRACHRLLWVAGHSLGPEGGWLRPGQPPREPEAKFEIPKDDGQVRQGMTLLAARWLVGNLAQKLRLDGWLHALLTDVAEVCLNEAQEERIAAWESLQRHLRDPRCGPVARWVFAEVLSRLDKPEMAAVFAHSAKTPLDAEAAWRDVLLVAGETGFSAIGAAWARDESPELRALFGADAASKPPMEIARAGFAHLWTKAFERPLRDRLRALDR